MVVRCGCGGGYPLGEVPECHSRKTPPWTTHPQHETRPRDGTPHAAPCPAQAVRGGMSASIIFLKPERRTCKIPSWQAVPIGRPQNKPPRNHPRPKPIPEQSILLSASCRLPRILGQFRRTTRRKTSAQKRASFRVFYKAFPRSLGQRHGKRSFHEEPFPAGSPDGKDPTT